MSTTVSGIFTNEKAAHRAITMLKQHGYRDGDISILASENSADHEIKMEESTKAPEGAAVGAGIGGTLGAIAGGLTAIGTITLTGGIGLLAAGPVVAALAGAGAGGAVGGLTGGLVGLGFPETEAKFVEDHVGKGYVLLGITVDDDRKSEVKNVFEEANAEQVTIH